MRSFLSHLLRLSHTGGPDGLLAGPASSVAIAGGLSLLTLTASLYMFMFAGRGYLPLPPAMVTAIARSLDPVLARFAVSPPAVTAPTPVSAAEPEAGPETLAMSLAGGAGAEPATAAKVATAIPAAAATGAATATPAAAGREHREREEPKTASGDSHDSDNGSQPRQTASRGHHAKD